MKIGCCLAYYKNHNNYGTSLQGYALVKVLQSLGHDVRIIKYQKRDIWTRRMSDAPLKLISGGYQAYLRRIRKQLKNRGNSTYAQGIRVRTDVNNRFKDVHMEPLCDNYIGYAALQAASLRYDAVLVGSDQVWTPLGLYSNFYNLNFVVDSVRRISYASSFGVSSIPWWQRKATGRYLNRIHFLSVREIKGKEIVEELSDNKATVVCDPTLLRSRTEWEKELKEVAPIVEVPYIFCYILGNNAQMRSEITEFAKSKGLKIVALRHIDEYLRCDDGFGDIAPYDVNPLDFVQLIRNARYVFTDSFHATVFSIIFNRQFLTFYRYNSKSKNSRNSRIDSLFALLGISGRLYDGNINMIDEPIEYESVNEQLLALREKSKQFLIQALSPFVDE